MDQILIRILGLTYTFIALPAMATIAIFYHRKNKTKGSILFAAGAVASTFGSMFNQLFPIRMFIEQSSGSLSSFGKMLTSTALILHLAGFLIMVAAWGVITFSDGKRIV
jgi:hypothetical protein